MLSCEIDDLSKVLLISCDKEVVSNTNNNRGGSVLSTIAKLLKSTTESKYNTSELVILLCEKLVGAIKVHTENAVNDHHIKRLSSS